MAGIFASRTSSLAWGIAAVLAAFAAILTQPTQGFTGGDSFGPSLLLIALTGAVLARMQSLPKALLAGVGIGSGRAAAAVELRRRGSRPVGRCS